MADLHPSDPVELTIRGDRMDVVGLVSTLLVLLEDDNAVGGKLGELAEGRITMLLEDLRDHVNRQVNMGLHKREMDRWAEMVETDEDLSYRGIQLFFEDFDPRQPDEAPDPIDANARAIVQLHDDQMWYGSEPASLDVESSLVLASLLRQAARDIEESFRDEELDAREDPEAYREFQEEAGPNA